MSSRSLCPWVRSLERRPVLPLRVVIVLGSFVFAVALTVFSELDKRASKTDKE